MANSEMVHKVTLGTGKVVLLKDVKMRHQELAMRAVGGKAGDNQFLFGSLFQKELIKILLVKVDEKLITPADAERIDELFTLKEYLQVSSVLAKLLGEADLGEPKIEFVSSGM